jgi:hypothetical protein
MTEGLMDAPVIGRYFGGKSPKWGRDFLKRCPVPTYEIGGKKYVRQAELDAWIELQKTEPKPAQETTSLKAVLKSISDRVLQQRRTA